jgi:hypothetical protein
MPLIFRRGVCALSRPHSDTGGRCEQLRERLLQLRENERKGAALGFANDKLAPRCNFLQEHSQSLNNSLLANHFPAKVPKMMNFVSRLRAAPS